DVLLCSSDWISRPVRSFPTRRSSDLLARGFDSQSEKSALFRPQAIDCSQRIGLPRARHRHERRHTRPKPRFGGGHKRERRDTRRSEEHTSELQSRENLVCRLLLEKKK